MARTALLIQETPTLEDGNYLRFAHELVKSGHTVDILFIDSLRLLAGQVTGQCFLLAPGPKARLVIPGEHCT